MHMEEHVYCILAIEGIIEREEKQQPEPPPKYIQSTDNNTEHIERGRILGAQP